MKGTPPFGKEEEYLYPLRGVFRELFDQARVSAKLLPVRDVFIAAWGPVTTVGGKTKEALVLNIDCTRAAADQIDWDNVDVSGMKTLCEVRKFVR
jgi:hypothetical protein